MLYATYDEEFNIDGFYDDGIHDTIPKHSVMISYDLWQELLKENYKIRLDNINENEELQLRYKDLYFVKVQMEKPNISLPPNQNYLLTQQIASLNLENKKKDIAISNLAKTVAELNIKIQQIGGIK